MRAQRKTYAHVLVHVTRFQRSLVVENLPRTWLASDGKAYAVAVIRQSYKASVGQISYNLAPTVSPEIARE